jgi:hypothetical protein
LVIYIYFLIFASYLDLHLEIDSEGWLRTKLYDKREDFNYPIVSFPFICSNISAAPTYGEYISPSHGGDLNIFEVIASTLPRGTIGLVASLLAATLY